MSIDDGVEIVGGSVANKETAEVVSCTHETIKVTLLKDIPSRNRSAKGVILQRLSKNDSIINAFASDKVIANKNGRSLRLPDVSARALTGTKRTGVDIELGHFEL
jgi:DNA gyrase/topoisomerase IV subunit A